MSDVRTAVLSGSDRSLGGVLDKARNVLLTEVGPIKPIVELLRRSWLPIAAVSEFETTDIKGVRLLGETRPVIKKGLDTKTGVELIAWWTALVPSAVRILPTDLRRKEGSAARSMAGHSTRPGTVWNNLSRMQQSRRLILNTGSRSSRAQYRYTRD
jgi:hypothetical protein